jgi:radical SAM protein with 4Fe4S-binding SPASM domain
MSKSRKFPLAVEIEINSDCNLSCSYCPNSKAERVEKGHMDKELFNTVLDQLASFSYDGRISFHFYNEPTLSPNLDEFIRLTKQKLPKAWLDLFSNGTSLDKDRIEYLSSLGIDKFTLTKHALSETPDHGDSKKIYLTHFRDLRLTNRAGSVPIKSKQKPPLNLPCFIPDCAIVITVKGNVVPCYEDFFQKNVMGNIKDRHILDIWNSPKYQAFRETLKSGQRHLLEACKDCDNTRIIN